NALPSPQPAPEPRAIAFTDGLELRQAFHLTADEIDLHIDRLNALVPCPSRAAADLSQMAVHESRYIAWLLGMTWEEIADAERIHYTVARRSCWYFLVKSSLLEQIQARNTHSMARAHNEHNDAYFKA